MLPIEFQSHRSLYVDSFVDAVCVTSPEPSFALLTEFVDGFLSTLCLQMCGLLLFVKMALLHVFVIN